MVRETASFVASDKMAHLENEQDRSYWEDMLAALKRGAKPEWADDTGLPEQPEA